jgi:hypothetical protein
MSQKVQFDFIEFAYNRLVKNFQNYILFERTIPFRDIYRIFGLLFSLNKQQTRVVIEDIARRYDNIKKNCQGVKILT